MFKRTVTDLGLDQVLQSVSSHALGPGGAAAVRMANPVLEQEAWLMRQKQVAAVMYALAQASSEHDIRVESFPDISDVFDFLSSNQTSSLAGEQVYNTGLFIRSATLLHRLLGLATQLGCPDRDSKVEEIIPEVPENLLYLEQEIFRILDSPGVVKENYPTVKALREKADSRRMERSRLASELMRSNANFMQSDTAVMRDGRIVLPVRSESKPFVEGYVQSSSASGGTVFMEPFRLVDMNNAVIMANEEIQLEIARLIGRLSDMVRESEESLRVLSSQVVQADFLYAFASWARISDCCRTALGDPVTPGGYTCNLIRARHPLLGAKCVPIDLAVASGIKAVVLTGPNAGGKTVTMKTVGLFSLLNQICGFIPAADGSSMALFDRVFTDIGDEQSIAENLSTFSGHMKSIGFILRTMTPSSLVILDELGSGTDPQEGAALARSILEFCTKKAALTLTTSHHGVLKQYAYGSDIVLNASMEFDEKTLEPTFKVIEGLPGESHAIDTARRMRLPKTVTLSARRYMGQEAVKISSIIRNLEILRKESEEAKAELNRRLREAEEEQRALEKERRRLQAYENRLKKQRLGEIDDFIRTSRRDVENLVTELREGEITREKTLKTKELFTEMQQQADALRAQTEEAERILDEQQLAEDNASEGSVELKEGMDVLCGPSKREGTVIKSAGKGKWQVAIGAMKFTFKETELTVPRRAKTVRSYSFEGGSSSPAPKLNLDLRGYRLLEALDAIDSQIEACCVHGLKSFSIIHGYGDGILSTGIHRHLGQNGLVQSFRFALPDDGGQGKTYVELK
ncbi:MAG: Smr/MutS family protein [Spirochaetales bacterium]|nr:Smr/MutS family protein [Spirochaetales bacterium]